MRHIQLANRCDIAVRVARKHGNAVADIVFDGVNVAAARVNPTSPALEKVYGLMLGLPASPVEDDVLTIAPPDPASIARKPARSTWKAPSALTARHNRACRRSGGSRRRQTPSIP